MSTHTLLVLNNPAAKHLALLSRLPDSTRIVAGETAEIFADAAPEADVLMIGGAVPREVIEQVWAMAPNLKWVHSMSAGMETMMFPALVESDVPLTNVRGAFSRSLGEFAMAGILWFSKELDRLRRQQREGRWEKYDVEELHGRILGVVGHGSIGRAAAALAAAFGMDIVCIGRKHTPEEFDEILSGSDYLLLATPLTEETRGLIGEKELRQMKPSAVLLNLGRGPVVVEEALIRALREGWIRGAVLDVYDTEPLAAEHPFWAMENVLLSPHCADNTATWLEDAMEIFLENFRRFDKGDPLRNNVDKRRGY